MPFFVWGLILKRFFTRLFVQMEHIIYSISMFNNVRLCRQTDIWVML